MRLNISQFPAHLQQGVQSLYLVSGDEPLQMMEACDQLRQVARSAGYTERKIYHVQTGFDWNEVLLSGNSMSLFAEKKVIELRMPTGKAGTRGSKLLGQIAQNPPPDTLFMVITGKLDAGIRKSVWYRHFESNGVHLQIWPVPVQQLPRWISRRMRQCGLHASSEAVDLLSDRIEGNLLAADQEIRKLGMWMDKGNIDVEDVMVSVADSSRHNVFEFIDAALVRQVGKLSRMLGHVRAEGAEPLLVLWALAREFRLLKGVAFALEEQRNPDQIMDHFRVWKTRRTMVGNAARRQQPSYWQNCLNRCAKIDRMVKGLSDGSPWDELLQLGIRIAR